MQTPDLVFKCGHRCTWDGAKRKSTLKNRYACPVHGPECHLRGKFYNCSDCGIEVEMPPQARNSGNHYCENHAYLMKLSKTRERQRAYVMRSERKPQDNNTSFYGRGLHPNRDRSVIADVVDYVRTVHPEYGRLRPGVGFEGCESGLGAR